MMAHGERAAKNANQMKELWSSRPFSGVPTGRVPKTLCHRKERRDADRDVKRQMDWFDWGDLWLARHGWGG